MNQETANQTCPVMPGAEAAAAIPKTGNTYEVDAYPDVLEVLRNSKLLALLHDDSEPFRGGTVRQIDGPVHHRRRKTMGQLLRGQGDDWFREKVLMPTISTNLDSVLEAADEDGYARTDMVEFVRRAFFQLAASLIGLQGVDDLEHAEELRVFCEPINAAMRSWYEEGDKDALMARGLEVKEEFRTRYFEPAYQHHVELLEKTERGECPVADLPHDLLTLVVKGEDPDLATNHELVLRESLTDMINAGTFSSAFTLLHILDDCLKWFEAHPEDWHLRTDPTFLYGAVAEGLRLHPIVPLLFRIADEDVTLSSGKEFKRGDTICINVRPANRDRNVFGENADEFDPRREGQKGIYPYGLTFGTGRHMCFGLPLILGSDGINGSHVQLIKAFFEAGVEYDPDNLPAMRSDAGQLAMWERYPVRFAGPKPRD